MTTELSQYVLEKRERLWQPIAVTGDRLYGISSQNGLYPDPWGGHVPHEMWGIWCHPIKLLDGIWFKVAPYGSQVESWLFEADSCRITPIGVEYKYVVGPIVVHRQDFVPDGVEGLVITLSFQSHVSKEQPLEVTVVARSDLRPAWLGEEKGLYDGIDKAFFDSEGSRLIFQDGNNDWAAVITTIPSPEQADLKSSMGMTTAGQGVTASLKNVVQLSSSGKAQLQIFIAGTQRGLESAQQELHGLINHLHHLRSSKEKQAKAILSSSQLICSDAEVEQAFAWVKLNCQMLAREVPGIGRGVGAGLPTYPWWFGIDSEYAISGMLQCGLFDLSLDTIALLHTISEQENESEEGRVIHELSTTGIVYNPGNLVETPLFVRVVYQTWLWTGDTQWLKEMYPFCKSALLEYTLGTCDPDADLCPSGRSIIETLEMHAGFECIDPACYTWEALHFLSDMARVVGDEDLPPLERMAEDLGKCIREEWWINSEGLFADIRATKSEVKQALKEIHQRATDHPNEEHLQQQSTQAHALFEPLLEDYQAVQEESRDLPWLLKHWVILCPMEVGLATREQAETSLERLGSEEFCTQEGMRLHPQKSSLMSINTGLLAVANARYGKMDEALRLLHTLSTTITLHMPGAISEMLPDRGCFLQLWSILGIVTPIVEGFAGIQPRAAAGHVRITPRLPSGWSTLELNNVLIGDARINLKVYQTDDSVNVEVTADRAFNIELGVCLPHEVQEAQFTQDGASVEPQLEVTTRGREVFIPVEGHGSIKVVYPDTSTID